MSEWNNIDGVEGWSKKLGELLAEARNVGQDDDLDARLELNDRLMQFIIHSYPNTEEIKALDSVAAQTASALLLDSIDKRLSAISQRTGTYVQINKELRSAAEVNVAQAESIRLKGATDLIDSATKTIEAARTLKSSLTSKAADKKLDQKIDGAVTAIEELRKSVAKVF